jgi:hypothetical protein
MDIDFKAQLSSAIHGSYSADGTSYIYLHKEHKERRRQGIELHEWVHSELLDNSAYGRFQQMLALFVRRAPLCAFRDRCQEVLNYSMTACAVAHEGLASYRELCWLVANEDISSAKQYLENVPQDYREGIDQVSQLLGDPFVGHPYKGLTPPQFHTLLITIGIALMNTPIIAAYTDPERILQQQLAWVILDGPNQRLEEFVNYADKFAVVLRKLRQDPKLEIAVAAFVQTGNTFRLQEFWDFGIETLRAVQPNLPMLTKTEADALMPSFNTNWLKYIEALTNGEVSFERQTRKDVSAERSLTMRVYPSDYEQHESSRAAEMSVPVEFAYLVRTAEALQSTSIVSFTFVTTVNPHPGLDDILEAKVGLLVTPMWAEGVSVASPWADSHPSFLSETTVADLLSASENLSGQGLCWYTNQTIVTFLRELDRLPDGFLFERCANADLVLRSLDHARRCGSEADGYCVSPFKDEETLVGVVYKKAISFSFVRPSGLFYFRKIAAERGLAELTKAVFRIGPHEIPLGSVTRWARWGALGH